MFHRLDQSDQSFAYLVLLRPLLRRILFQAGDNIESTLNGDDLLRRRTTHWRTALTFVPNVHQQRPLVQLGYGIRLVRQNGEITGFGIDGVSDALCERFSKRREEIERQIEKFEEKQGRKPTVKEVALIARETRPGALKEIATSEVVAFQRSQLSPEEWRQLQSLRSEAETQTMSIQPGQERKALRASVSHLFERSSVLREHEILAEALYLLSA